MKRRRHAAGGARVLIIVLAAFVGLILLLVGKAPDRETEFAPGYTDAAFARIHVGVPADRVLQLLGEPLSKSADDTTESWHYSRATVSPDHMTIRRVVIDRRMQTVIRVDRRTRFDYFGQMLSSGDAQSDYGD